MFHGEIPIIFIFIREAIIKTAELLPIDIFSSAYLKNKVYFKVNVVVTSCMAFFNDKPIVDIVNMLDIVALKLTLLRKS